MGTLRTQIKNNFLTGVLVVLPLAATIWVIRIIFRAVNPSLTNWIFALLKDFIGDAGWKKMLVLALAKLAVLFVIFMLLVIIGAFARNVFGRRLLRFVELLFEKIPLVNWIYKTVQQISHAVLGESRGVFSKVVLVEYPRKGIYTIGLLSAPLKGEIADTEEGLVSVFIPTTPNPTSGLLIMVPQKELRVLEMSVEEGLKLLISGGIVMPKKRGAIKGEDGDKED